MKQIMSIVLGSLLAATPSLHAGNAFARFLQGPKKLPLAETQRPQLDTKKLEKSLSTEISYELMRGIYRSELRFSRGNGLIDIQGEPKTLKLFITYTTDKITLYNEDSTISSVIWARDGILPVYELFQITHLDAQILLLQQIQYLVAQIKSQQAATAY